MPSAQPQYTNAFLIVRTHTDSRRRVIGTAHSRATGEVSCRQLATAPYNLDSGITYTVEQNTLKYNFDAKERPTPKF